MKPKVPTGFTRRLLTTAATVIGLAPVAFAQVSGAQAADPQTFFVLNNPNDPMFNQLLGINNGNVIVGYYGDGMAIHNNGYVLVPANHYSIDNFTNVPNCTAPPSTPSPPPPMNSPCPPQTQAIGINDATGLAGKTPFPDIVGFYQDINGAQHGFVDSVGVQSTIDDPMGLRGITTPLQNLLGINNALTAAGFWTDNNNHEHGFVVEINTQTPTSSKFVELPSTGALAGAVATQASDITNNNLVCGFFTAADGNNHAFEAFFNPTTGTFPTPPAEIVPHGLVLPPNNTPVTAGSISPLGCNDKGEVVGFFIASAPAAVKGNTYGFVFDGQDWHLYMAPGSSQTPAFMTVAGTTINGINTAGTIVGFFSDGENVNGFVDFAPVP
jgi:hypothetical protein